LFNQTSLNSSSNSYIQADMTHSLYLFGTAIHAEGLSISLPETSSRVTVARSVLPFRQAHRSFPLNLGCKFFAKVMKSLVKTDVNISFIFLALLPQQRHLPAWRAVLSEATVTWDIVSGLESHLASDYTHRAIQHIVHGVVTHHSLPASQYQAKRR
jgi:hypothetical protein